MKHLLVLILFIGLSSCFSEGAENPTKCLNSVSEKYPGATIFVIPNSFAKFVVVDGNNIHWVETMSADGPGITSDIVIYSYNPIIKTITDERGLTSIIMLKQDTVALDYLTSKEIDSLKH